RRELAVANELAPRLPHPGSQPGVENVPARAIEQETESGLDQIAEQLPFDVLEHTHAAEAGSRSGASASRAVAATVGSTSRARVRSASRASGECIRPRP